LQKEDKGLRSQITSLNKIIDDHATLMKVIKKEIKEVRDNYADNRRTKIEDKVQEIEVDTRVMVASEDVRLLVSHDGYVKRSSLRSYQASTGDNNGLKDEDYPIIDQNVNTLDHLFVFTDKGNLIYRQIFEIEDSRWKDMGSHLSQEIGLDADESILKAFVFKDLKETGNFLAATTENYIKQVAFSDLLPGRTYKSRASKYCKLKGADARVMNVYYVPKDASNLIYVFTEHSYASAFPITEVPVVSGKAIGVKFVSLKDDDAIAGYFMATDENDKIAVLTQRGSYKQMKLSEIPVTSRARRGVLTLRELKRQPHRIMLVTNVSNDMDISIITDTNKQIEIDRASHQSTDRYSNGSFIMDPATDGNPVRFVKEIEEK